MIRKQSMERASSPTTASITLRTSHPPMVSSWLVDAVTPVVTLASASMLSSSRSESGL